MKEKNLTLPEIGLIAITRVVLGVGIGLIFANKLSPAQRRRVGCTLLTVGGSQHHSNCRERLRKERVPSIGCYHIACGLLSFE